MTVTIQPSLLSLSTNIAVDVNFRITLTTMAILIVGHVALLSIELLLKETEIKTPLALRGNIQILHFNGGNVQLVGKVIDVEISKSKLTVQRSYDSQNFLQNNSLSIL
jgi:hypothetical protein